jgi:sugar/nucleoside kinase (ribokinase family)
VILVVGDVMRDVIVTPLGAPAPGTDQRARIARRFGGSGANIACWLGHIGVPTRFAGRVAAADVAEHVSAFAAHHVDARLAADPRLETGSVVAVLGAAGERGFYTDRGANLALGEADLGDALLAGVDALHVSGHVFFEAGPRAAARRLMAVAAARGVSVSVDAGSAGWLAEAAGRFPGWTGASLCFANAAEAALLGDAFPTLVVTRGPEGAEVWSGGAARRVPARVVEVVDGTGAGDAFTAGYLAATLRGATPAEGLAEGVVWASVCLRLAGGRPLDA